jgi:diguanylate cyclase (GGDEF)-like protein
MHTISGQLVADSVEALMAAVVAEDIPVLSSALEQVFADEAVDGLEIRFRLAPVAASPRAERVCDLSLRALTNEFGVVTGAVGCLSDVTDRIQLRRELEIRASVDKLTSCLNRDAALELLGRTTRAAAGLGDGNALVFVDVDRLKSVNDQLGHGAGDRLLDAVGDRLRHAARRGDAVGRVGGDEFIVICPRVAGPAQAVVIAERIAAATTANIDVGDDVVEMRTSVGVSWTNEALDADTFLAQADAAMYQSKRTSDKRVTLFAANP